MRPLRKLSARSGHPDPDYYAGTHSNQGANPAGDRHAQAYPDAQSGGERDAQPDADFGARSLPAFQFDLGSG